MKAESSDDARGLFKRSKVCLLLAVNDDTLRKMIEAGLFPPADIIEPGGAHKWKRATVYESIDERAKAQARDRDSKCATCRDVDDGVCPACGYP